LLRAKIYSPSSTLRSAPKAAGSTKATTPSSGRNTRFDAGANTLIVSRQQRISFFNPGIDAAVAAGPAGMLAEQTHASLNNNLHKTSCCRR